MNILERDANARLDRMTLAKPKSKGKGVSKTQEKSQEL
jgi:hypothetical protein